MAELYIGLMSGTSADGIDAALVEVDDDRPHFVRGHFLPYPDPLRQRLLELAHAASTPLETLYALDAELGELLAEAGEALLASSGLSAASIRAIGSHGHTIRHRPDATPAFTAQIGDANRIAQRLRRTVVADFRRRDVAAGGQGAPLAPAMHAACLHSHDEHRAVLNLGGIANLTLLPHDASAPTVGFDSGPASCLMDYWIGRHRDLRYDAGGAWAARGDCLPGLLSDLLADEYFARPAPKSTGREHFSPDWLQVRLCGYSEARAEDVQATLLELSAHSVVDALQRSAPRCERLLVCGGGVHNEQLMARLGALAQGVAVESTAAVGWDPDWIEATCFAWLASRTLAGRPGNLPAVTGAAAPVVLGAIHPG